MRRAQAVSIVGPATVAVGAAVALVPAATVPLASGLAAIVVTTVYGLTSVGRVFVVLAVATASWNALQLAPVSPSDLFLAIGTLLLALPLAAGIRLPPWIAGGLVLVALAGLLAWLVEPGTLYMDGRYRLSTFSPDGVQADRQSSAEALGKFAASLVLVPAAVILAGNTPRRLMLAFDAWALGALVSAAFAITDSVGLSNVGPSLLGFVSGGGRETGLTGHPNHLMMSSVMALPVVVSWSARPGAWKIASLPALGSLGLSIVLSGSRTGAVAAPLVLLLTVWLMPTLRPYAARVALPCLVAILLLPTVAGSVIDEVGERVRLQGSPSTTRSDTVRSLVTRQGVEDFRKRPLFGVGPSVIREAHSIYLEGAAALGLLGLLGLGVYFGGAIRHGWRRLSTANILAAPAVASVCGFLVAGLFANALTDRYLYVPVGVIAALWWHSWPSHFVSQAGEHPHPPRPIATREPRRGSGASGRYVERRDRQNRRFSHDATP